MFDYWHTTVYASEQLRNGTHFRNCNHGSNRTSLLKALGSPRGTIIVGHNCFGGVRSTG